MRYSTLIFCFCFIFAGCKSDKVSLSMAELQIPQHLLGMWDAKSAVYGQGFDNNTDFWYTFPTYDSNISNSPFAFQIEFKESKTLNVIVDKKVITSFTFKVIQYIDNEICQLTHIQLNNKENLYFVFTKETGGLTSKYTFVNPETFDCVNFISPVTYNFKKI